MKFKVPNNLKYTSDNILRSCGYFKIFDNRTQKTSFIRKITQNRYPRFHLYLEEVPQEIVFDLHLDQSRTVYSGQTAHNADYDSSEVKRELARIFQEVKKSLPEEKAGMESKNPAPKSEDTETPNWLSKLFKKP